MPCMQQLVEDFLQYLRHERGQSEQTQKTYQALLGKCVAWATAQGIRDWKSVELSHLMAFLQHERTRQPADAPRASPRTLSPEIAALRAFYRFCETEKYLPVNVAENLSLPRRWQRLPKALSNEEIERLLKPFLPETPPSLCDQALLELAYAAGLRLAELRNLRLEQLHLEASFVTVVGKGNKERVVPVGRPAVAAVRWDLEVGQPRLVTPRSPANVFRTRRGTHFASVTLWLRIKRRVRLPIPPY
jgi:integrase/recombinase XerD